VGGCQVDQEPPVVIAIVGHLRERLGKEKIVVMGFSWGSVVGIQLVKKRYEWLHAYVGVG
jgi:alpha/beta superfamily hydrolase